MNPKVLHGLIVENNAAVFNNFIEFPKPILIAANGPAIGAWSVKSFLIRETFLNKFFGVRVLR